MKKNKVLTWVFAILFAIVLTLSAAVYQRITGPTYPKKVSTEINGKTYNFSLLRSNNSTRDAKVLIPIQDIKTKGNIVLRRFPTNDGWDTIPMNQTKEGLVAYLPMQAPAGKLEYFVQLVNDQATINVMQDEPVIIRFKGEVPAEVLIPHIIFMFFGMFFANLAGILAIIKIQKSRMTMWITFVLILLGGMIFGPIVQKYAFGEYWTGIPFGYDLTDNKTLIAFLAWLVAVVVNIKKYRPGYIIAAAIITLVIFLVPHSMFGSQLNHATGTIGTGK